MITISVIILSCYYVNEDDSRKTKKIRNHKDQKIHQSNLYEALNNRCLHRHWNSRVKENVK